MDERRHHSYCTLEPDVIITDGIKYTALNAASCLQLRNKNPSDLEAEELIASICEENDNCVSKSTPRSIDWLTLRVIVLETVQSNIFGWEERVKHILNDKLSLDKDDILEDREDPLLLGPEISIIPVIRKSGKIRVRNFLEEERCMIIHRERSTRGNVRIVTADEAVKAENENSYSKRKSLPLEKCHICKKFFRRMKTHLLKHEEKQRDPNDPLTCKLCMKAFNTYSNLSIHMRTHTGDKPYICDICNKSFSQSCNLVNHLRIHTGERPYKCPHCDRAFTQSGNLTNHIRLHTDEKPFKCHFCDRAFTQSGNLNSHIRNNHKFDDSRSFSDFH